MQYRYVLSEHVEDSVLPQSNSLKPNGQGCHGEMVLVTMRDDQAWVETHRFIYRL